MRLNELLMPEFDQEMKNTRKLLERMPLNKAEWQPHVKSMALGRLAGHVAELPNWGAMILSSETMDLTPMINGGRKPFIADSPEGLLEVFDKGVSEVRNALAKTGDDDFDRIWSIQLNGQTVFSMPRLATFRSMFMNHLIHHRAQLGVYFRMNGIPLPEMYGPSADEGVNIFASKK
jgi:uncharacterized damage-inducible protein DinB